MCLSLSSLLSLVLVLGVSLGASLPHDVPRNGCRLSKYQNIAPEEKKAVDKMRQEFVSIAGDRGLRAGRGKAEGMLNSRPERQGACFLQQFGDEEVIFQFFSLSLGLCLQVSSHKCNTRLFYRKWKAADLPMSDRVLLVAAELNLTTAMLELPAVPSFAQVRRRPLQFFRQAREDVLGCVSVDPSQQPSGRLRHWLHKLQAAVHTVSQDSAGTLSGCQRPHFRADSLHLPPQETPESTACLRATTILHALQARKFGLGTDNFNNINSPEAPRWR
ncbi:interferon lambda-3-like [Cyanistes caeruleus]|uniref:interferon lambda-3-like n=1 Tax=Cyanistes caeruleus TaxID=156563 RepID=UPI000CDB0DA7|nr:interferon lambda-3-like [Cyanistes caeruleus]